jgi:CRISPR-associated protein Csa1
VLWEKIMFYIAFSEGRGHEIAKTILNRPSIDENLRGWNVHTWPPPELSDIKISVSDLSFDVCPTNRNLYLTKIKGVSRTPDSSRVIGKATEKLYFLTYSIVADQVAQAQSSSIQNLDPWALIQQQTPSLVDQAVEFAKKECEPEDTKVTNFPTLKADLQKALDFEAHMATALLQHQLSRLREHRVGSFFDDLMRFAIEPTYKAEDLGFSTPVKPDFLYGGRFIGDIKTGKWHDFLRLNLTAYALAYECDRDQPMDLGLIHHVEFKNSHPVPLHYHTEIIFIGNALRAEFTAKRDSKLEVMLKGEDPGKPSKSICEANDCPFIPNCWTAL